MALNGLNKYQGFGRLTRIIEGFLKMKILSGNMHKHCIPNQEQLQNIQLYIDFALLQESNLQSYYSGINIFFLG
jgi:hypothetical protein